MSIYFEVLRHFMHIPINYLICKNPAAEIILQIVEVRSKHRDLIVYREALMKNLQLFGGPPNTNNKLYQITWRLNDD